MPLNTHDKKRRKAAIKALEKAKQKLEIESLYLSVKDGCPIETIYQNNDAYEHVLIALERLGGGEDQ